MICSENEKCACLEFETPKASVIELFDLINPTSRGALYDLDWKRGSMNFTDPQSQSKLHVSAFATIPGNVVVTMTKASFSKEIIDWYF